MLIFVMLRLCVLVSVWFVSSFPLPNLRLYKKAINVVQSRSRVQVPSRRSAFAILVHENIALLKTNKFFDYPYC